MSTPVPLAAIAPQRVSARYSHYFKPCPYDAVDIYRVLQMFEVSDPALQHAVKKLLVAGGRGAKSSAKDVQEAIDALLRWQEMREEESQELPARADVEVRLAVTIAEVDALRAEAAQAREDAASEEAARHQVEDELSIVKGQREDLRDALSVEVAARKDLEERFGVSVSSAAGG
jgi:hypothetical protein